MQDLSEFAGNEIGIDVVRLAVFTDSDGGNDRNELAALQQGYDFRIDALDGAHLADIKHFAVVERVLQQQFFGTNETAILASQTDGAAAIVVDQVDDVLVDQATQNHFDDVHGLAVRHTHALDELPLLADALEHVVNLGPATMDNHGIHADELQQH